jgi:hypothetical protein
MKITENELGGDETLQIAEFPPQRRTIKFSYRLHKLHEPDNYVETKFYLPFPHIFLFARLKDGIFANRFSFYGYASHTPLKESIQNKTFYDLPLPNVDGQVVCLGKGSPATNGLEALDEFWQSKFNTDIITTAWNFFMDNFNNGKEIFIDNYSGLVPYFKQWEQMDISNMKLRKSNYFPKELE